MTIIVKRGSLLQEGQNITNKANTRDSYDCNLCDAKFQRKLCLDEHKFKHVGGKYYCNQCNALYATQAYLKANKLVQYEGHR